MARVFPFITNPMNYPSRLAGFDPTHIASKNVRISAVATASGNFISLLTGKPGTPTGVTAGIKASVGPSVTFGNPSTNVVTLNTSTLALPANCTMAAIFVYVATANFNVLVSARQGSLATYILCGRGISQGPELYDGAVERSSLLTIVAGVPYFTAVSTNQSVVNFVLTRLDTSQTRTTTIAGGAPSGTEGQYGIGNNANNGYPGSISAGMYGASYLTVPQLLEWAQDPWAFWYPRTLDLAYMLSPTLAPAALPFAPSLLQTRGAPGLGPQSRHTALLNAALPTPPVVVPTFGGTLPFMGVG